MKLLGRYVLEDVLASGGMATIHRARHAPSGRHVAVKILKRAFADDPVQVTRFQREALSLSRLVHPNIVGVMDFGEEDGQLFLVLELVDGETLEAQLAREGAFPLTRALPVMQQILFALEGVHAVDLIHRDLKPSNVMITKEGVKLIDFGLAHLPATLADKLTETGVVQGTAQYMSPEQCRGEEVGTASDVYSAGVLFYEMLAGRAPFSGADAATLMAQHLFVDPPALVGVAPGVADAIRAALAKKADDRPTARAFREALADAARGVDPTTRASAAADARRAEATRGRPPASASEPVAAESDARVVVWMPPGARSAALLACLGAAKYTVELAAGDDPPMHADVVILSDVGRVARVGRVPAVVVDIATPDATTAAIRAGAKDMLLASAPDADLIEKVRRILRRRPA